MELLDNSLACQSSGTHNLVVIGARCQCEGSLDLFNKQVLVSGQYFGVFYVFVEQRQHFFSPVPMEGAQQRRKCVCVCGGQYKERSKA